MIFNGLLGDIESALCVFAGYTFERRVQVQYNAIFFVPQHRRYRIERDWRCACKLSVLLRRRACRRRVDDRDRHRAS